jgi:hypothetical protein
MGKIFFTSKKTELEMVGMEERYKKYIEKAKSVIKTLDPKQTPGGGAPPEVNLLRSQLAEKDRVIDELEKESEKSKVRGYLLFSFFQATCMKCFLNLRFG